VAGCLAVGVVGSVVVRSRLPKPVRERVLIGAIDNHTGRDDFGFVRHLLSLSLAEQAPQIEVLSPDDVQETLQQMSLPKGTKVDRVIEREICQRRNAGTWITGTVDPVAGGFQIAVTVTDPEDGQVRGSARRKVADEKELLTGAVDKIADQLRGAIGKAALATGATRR